jgi:hypothetical protein
MTFIGEIITSYSILNILTSLGLLCHAGEIKRKGQSLKECQ